MGTSGGFYSKYEAIPESGCWLWNGATDTPGYGRLKWRGRVDGAHRVSWMIHFGEIPDGMFVCHKCDVKCCVNPAHLFLGTNSENIVDCVRKGKFGRVRLSFDCVAKIIERCESGESQESVAAAFGIGQSHVGRLVRREARTRG